VRNRSIPPKKIAKKNIIKKPKSTKLTPNRRPRKSPKLCPLPSSSFNLPDVKFGAQDPAVISIDGEENETDVMTMDLTSPYFTTAEEAFDMRQWRCDSLLNNNNNIW
jgi:hypothetical protein